MTNQEAIDLLDNLIGMIEDNHGSDYDSAIRMAIDVLKNQPEIIRCKDCEYSSPNRVYGCRLEPFDVNEIGFRMYGDDFCSRAEKKEGDAE